MTDISADDALQRLLTGNERFVRGEVKMRLHRETLLALAQGQRPYAAIVGCSDSRVPPELIFDVGLGEVFVMRVAGNVFTPGIVGSMQYAGVHLLTPLVVVLGHEGCGAVRAALKTRDHGEKQRSKVQFLVDNILPGLPDFDHRLSERERIHQAVESNVRWTVRQIMDGAPRLAERPLKVVGAIFEIKTARVRLLDEITT